MTQEPASPESTALSRRSALRAAAAVGVAVPAVGLLGACATSGSEGDKNTGGAKTAENPLGVKEDAPLEVVIFDGGLGQKYATDVHEPMYKQKYPKAEVKHQGAVEISTALQPRFSGGTPPDFVNNAGSKNMDTGALVGDGQMADLTDLFDAPSLDVPGKKVKDMLVPGTIEIGSYDGKPLVLNYGMSIFGLWYSEKLFKDNSWTAPKTWEEFTALCDKIKAKGISPFGYAGANAAYYMYLVILTSAAKLGGPDLMKKIDNLEDGAWKSEAVIKAATAWAEIGAKYMDKGYKGLKHTEVQLKQNQYQLAMYPSGSWLENEQKKDTPPGFNYQLMPIPSLTSSDKLPVTGLFASAGEEYFASAKAKNVQGAKEYMRIMLSKKGANEFVKTTGTLNVVVGSADGVELSPGLASAQKALSAAGKDVFYYQFQGWYKELDTEARNATNELMFGTLKADAWADRIQKKSDALKKDSAVKKFKRS